MARSKKINYASMFTLRSDGRYQGYWYDENGKRHSVCDKDPEKLYEKLQAKKYTPQPKKVITFKDVAEDWQQEHREQIGNGTWKNYKPHYDDIISKYGNLPVAEVSALDVSQDLLAAKARGSSATIVKTRRSLFRMIFDHAIVRGYTNFNPVFAVKLPKGLPKGSRRAPTDKEIKTILKNIDAPFGLFPFLLICTGLRKSEALALTWADIDFKNNVIHVTKALEYTNGASPKIKQPKTEAGMRDVSIVAILKGPLQEAFKRSESSLVFPQPASNRAGKGGGYYGLRAYEGAWQRYCEAVGFVDEEGKPTLTAHNLRHGTATLLFESKVDEMTTQRILGHSRIEITREIYTELRDKQLSSSVSKYDAKMKKLMAKVMAEPAEH